MGRLELTPATYRRITAVAVAALAFIVVTGAVVRLTRSGLGCPDWPTCDGRQVVPPWHYHQMVEFVNRTITGLVSLAVMLAVLGSLARRPRRTDLVRLSLGLVAGVLAQIVLGGLTVKFKLRPPFVMAHFLLSMAILADAVVLHHRAGRPGGPTRPVVGGDVVALGRLLVAGAGLVLFLGTVVTSSGPHGGDEHAERLPFLVPDVARLHGISVMALVALTLVVLWRLRRDGAPPGVLVRAEVLVGALAAQAAVGYAQYFSGVPPLLVAIHVAGAVAVWVSVLRLCLALSAPTGPIDAGGVKSGSHERVPVDYDSSHRDP